MADILFQTEDISFILPEKNKTKKWIEQVLSLYVNTKPITINFVFCSDAFLQEINKTYLGHDAFTDIITFDYADDQGEIEADVFISIERVEENSKLFNVPFYTELNRVMIHGVLHLLGFDDKTEVQRQKMREKENECLTLYPA